MKLFSLALAAVAMLATPAMAQDFSGPRVGVNVGIAGQDVASTDSKTYGANVGYDFHLTPGIVIGATAEYQRDFDVKGRDISATARIGTPVTKHVLVYVGGGYANIGSSGVNLDCYRLDGGLEVALGKNAYVTVEQRYSEYEFGLHANQTVAGVGLRF